MSDKLALLGLLPEWIKYVAASNPTEDIIFVISSDGSGEVGASTKDTSVPPEEFISENVHDWDTWEDLAELIYDDSAAMMKEAICQTA